MAKLYVALPGHPSSLRFGSSLAKSKNQSFIHISNDRLSSQNSRKAIYKKCPASNQPCPIHAIPFPSKPLLLDDVVNLCTLVTPYLAFGRNCVEDSYFLALPPVLDFAGTDWPELLGKSLSFLAGGMSGFCNLTRVRDFTMQNLPSPPVEVHHRDGNGDKM